MLTPGSLKNHIPDSVYAVLFMALSFFRDGICVRISKESNYWSIKDRSKPDVFFIPSPRFAGRIRTDDGISFGTQKKERYIKPNFIDINENETVIDVGAFIGEFSYYAASCGASVLAIEPDPISAECFRRNTSEFSNVVIEESVVWEEDDEKLFNFGDNPTENSLFDIDHGDERQSISTRTKTLDTITTEHNIEQIDFLKMDAEGAEPEVLRGLSKLPNKVSIDCSAERHGESTIQEVSQWLEERGYEIREENDIVYSRLN